MPRMLLLTSQIAQSMQSRGIKREHTHISLIALNPYDDTFNLLAFRVACIWAVSSLHTATMTSSFALVFTRFIVYDRHKARLDRWPTLGKMKHRH